MDYEENEALIEWVKKLIQMEYSIFEIIVAIKEKENCSDSQAMDIHAIASDTPERREFHEELEKLFLQEIEKEGATVKEKDGSVEISINLSQPQKDEKTE